MSKEQVKERRIPRSVDEAAQMLISDFLSQYLQVLARMTDEDLERQCRKFLPQIKVELNSRHHDLEYTETDTGTINTHDSESMRPVLERVKNLLSEFRGLFILT